MVNPAFSSEKSILLVDGNNLLIRILYAKNKGNNLLTPRELIESCALIFMHQITICTKKYSCSRLYIAFAKFAFDRDLGFSWKTSRNTLLTIVLRCRRNHRHDSLV